MDEEIMEIISDLETFVLCKKDAFVLHMIYRGFTEEDVDEMLNKLYKFLKDKRYR